METIWVAVIGGVSAILAAVLGAVIANWDKLRSRKADKSSNSGGFQPEQVALTRQPLAAPWSHKKATPTEIVQLMLRSAGYPVIVDGFAGEQTTGAIILFQRDNGLEVTGVVDDKTEKLLSTVRQSFEEVQRKLIKLGYPVGVDGLCGNNSSRALRAIQQKHGLAVTGLPDRATRRIIREIAD